MAPLPDAYDETASALLSLHTWPTAQGAMTAGMRRSHATQRTGRGLRGCHRSLSVSRAMTAKMTERIQKRVVTLVSLAPWCMRLWW